MPKNNSPESSSPNASMRDLIRFHSGVSLTNVTLAMLDLMAASSKFNVVAAEGRVLAALGPEEADFVGKLKEISAACETLNAQLTMVFANIQRKTDA